MTEYQFILTYKGNSLTLDPAPAGWNEIGVSFVRNKIYSSVLRSLALSMRFVKKFNGGGQFILDAYDTDGIAAVVEITINQRSKKTNAFELFYKGTLDFTPGNFVKDRDFVEISIKDSMKLQKFISRDELELNVFNTVSVDGDQVDPFQAVDQITLTTVDIIISSDSTCVINGQKTLVEPSPPATDTLEVYCSNPVYGKNELQDRFNLTQKTIYTNTTDETVTLTGEIFGYRNTLFDNMVFENNGSLDFVSVDMWQVIEARTEEGDLIQRIVIFGQENMPTPIYIYEIDNPISYTRDQFFNKNINFTLPTGSYVDFYTIYEINQGDVRVTQTGNVTVRLRETVQTYPDSVTNCMFPHEAFTRLIQLTTNEQDHTKLFRSEFFGKLNSQFQTYLSDGIGSKDAITNGLLIRNYPSTPLNLSIQKLFRSFDAVYCLGLGYDNINERFYIERKNQFYKPGKLIADLGEVSELKIYPAQTYFNEISCGYENDGNYENVQGANEINTQRTYSTNQPVKETLNIKSDYNFDSVGIELARRKSYTSFGSTDTRFDQNTYIIRTDGSRPVLNSNLTGFEGIVKYYNTMLSPRENLIRWAGWLKSVLWKTTTGAKYVSSAKNINMTYTNQNGLMVSELSDVPKSEFIDDPLFIPEIYEFKGYINSQIIASINEDPHGFFRCTFNGETYEGYIEEVKTGQYNEQATFKLLAKSSLSNENLIYENLTENLIYENGTENLVY